MFEKNTVDPKALGRILTCFHLFDSKKNERAVLNTKYGLLEAESTGQRTHNFSAGLNPAKIYKRQENSACRQSN